jgi:hypothetical protein
MNDLPVPLEHVPLLQGHFLAMQVEEMNDFLLSI